MSKIDLNLLDENFDEVIPFKHKKKKSVKKSNHKHDYQFCLIEYNKDTLDKNRGYIPKKSFAFTKYCTICGKINDELTPEEINLFYKNNKHNFNISSFLLPYLKKEYTDFAKLQFNSDTRTIPIFYLDNYYNKKYIDLNKLGEENYDKS